MRRRRFVAAAGVTGLTVVAGCLGGGGGAPAEPQYTVDGTSWFAPLDSGEFQGFVDMTDADEITVRVGAGERGYRFDPVAVAVAPGTEITWKWTGRGGGHNVAERDKAWSNPGGILEAKGHTWSRAFDNGGTELYKCRPHRSLGMVGGIFIDENPDSGPEYGIDEATADNQSSNETSGTDNQSSNETSGTDNQSSNETSGTGNGSNGSGSY